MNGEVSLWRLPRSGSTMLWRCYEAAGVVPDQGGTAHTIFTPKALPLVVTIRDFRDVALSQTRCFCGIGDLDGGIRTTLFRLWMLSIMVDENPSAVVWRYEDHYRKPDAVARFVANTAGVNITPDIAKTIETIVSPERAAWLADSVLVLEKHRCRPFMSYDRDSHIHHGHLGPQKGEPEAWRNESKDVRDLLNRNLAEHLERWGYAVE